MIFDGECHFCRRWIERWREATGDRVSYAPFQEVAAEFPLIPRSEFEHEVKLITPDGRIFGGAQAVFYCLNLAAHPAMSARLAGWLYRKALGFAPLTEIIYHWIARHRSLASTVTRWLWGNDVKRPTYITAQTWFLRALGVVFLIAFASLRVQIDGLIGHEGILPFAPLLDAARQQLGPVRGFCAYPTLCWLIGGSDFALHSLCHAGMVLSVLLIIGIAPALCLFLLWLSYLSLTVAGQTFLSFQWDILLLETGFLSIFIAPLRLLPGRSVEPPSTAIFLLRWLLFRLMLMSGVVKLTSGDASWLGLSALHYHYETQPLPTWIGWYAHQAPAWFQAISVAFVLLAELVVPFFVFGPRRVRMVGFVVLVLLQVLIAATGNYGFFNILTAALCLLLLDDSQWPRICQLALSCAQPAVWWSKRALLPVATIYILFGTLLLANAFVPAFAWPRPIAVSYSFLAPFRSLNGYGLFRVMTRTRPEIIVEGSEDGEHWLPYEFKWKAGDPTRAPRFVAPHQPRLDWQMWFAALGNYQDDQWFVPFAAKLLVGSPPVLDLLENNPFPQSPPRYIRATAYEYRFADLPTRKRTGVWWTREVREPYLPVISLRK